MDQRLQTIIQVLTETQETARSMYRETMAVRRFHKLIPQGYAEFGRLTQNTLGVLRLCERLLRAAQGEEVNVAGLETRCTALVRFMLPLEQRQLPFLHDIERVKSALTAAQLAVFLSDGCVLHRSLAEDIIARRQLQASAA